MLARVRLAAAALTRPSSEDALARGASFDEMRAEVVRSRFRVTLMVMGPLWVLTLLFADPQLFGAREAAYWIRLPELAGCGAIVAWLRRPRPRQAIERAFVLFFGTAIAASAYSGTLMVPEMVAQNLVSIGLTSLVLGPVVGLSWRSTLVLFAVAWIALLVAGFAAYPDQRADFAMFVAAASFAAILLVVGAASRDALMRSDYESRKALLEAYAKLRREDELRARLFVNLSHDFRTPLAVIRGEAELLRAAEPDPSRAEPMRRIGANATALADLTDQLLELARLDAGPLPLRRTPCNAAEMAHDVAASLQPPGGAPRIVVTGAAEVPAVLVDPAHLRRILTNLVANALRQAGVTEVAIALSRAGEGVAIDVSDDGPGVAPERRALVFDRFVSFDAQGGTASGIGLPLARELAVLNGGSLVLAAGPATFRLTLPATSEEPIGAAAPTALAAPSTAPNGRVLVVEDNEDMADLLARVLGGRFEVEHARSIAEALAALGQAAPVAVLCDVMLPDGSGYDVLRAVRASAALEGVPVLMLSALGEVEERVRGLAAGADDYIAKPFAPDELRGRLVAAIERAEAQRRALAGQRDDLLMEIHDGVSGSLARAALFLSEPSPGDARQRDAALEAVRDGLGHARSLASLVEARARDWSELVDGIQRETAAACEQASIRLCFEAPAAASRIVSGPIAHTILRVAREATTNVIRHAHAHELRCSLASSAHDVSLRIEDDGVGIGQAPDGRGVAIMRRRARQLGGTLCIGPGETGGTRVDLTLPSTYQAG